MIKNLSHETGYAKKLSLKVRTKNPLEEALRAFENINGAMIIEKGGDESVIAHEIKVFLIERYRILSLGRGGRKTALWSIKKLKRSHLKFEVHIKHRILTANLRQAGKATRDVFEVVIEKRDNCLVLFIRLLRGLGRVDPSVLAKILSIEFKKKGLEKGV